MKVSVTTPVWGCSVENLIGIAKLAEDSPIEALLSQRYHHIVPYLMHRFFLNTQRKPK